MSNVSRRISVKSSAVRFFVTTVSLLPARDPAIMKISANRYGGIRNPLFRLSECAWDTGLLNELLVRFTTDNRAQWIIWTLLYIHYISIFAMNSASTSGMHCSFTSHGLISFFHNFADSAICNIIDHFQADQLIRDHLYGSPRSTFRRLVTVYGTYPGFHIVSYFAMPIFLYFLARGGFHPIHDKTLGNALDCTAGSSVCVFDMIICPGFVLRLLVQCQKYLRMLYTVALFAFFINVLSSCTYSLVRVTM